MTAQIVAHFSLPSFRLNFSEEDGIIDEDLNKEFMAQFQAFQTAV
jgi:hypothetical protein